MKVAVDLGLCQGHAMCVEEAPDVFAYDKDTDQAVVLLDNPPADMHDQVRTAAKYCPALAIELTE